MISAINPVVEDINHQFTIEVLTQEFRSGDLSISARNLRCARENLTDILDRVDSEQVTAQLKTLLDILNQEE